MASGLLSFDDIRHKLTETVAGVLALRVKIVGASPPAQGGTPTNTAPLDVTATAQALAATSTPLKGGLLCAALGNTGPIYVSGAGVTTTSGIPLYPGASMDLSNVADLADLYAIRTAGAGSFVLNRLPLV